MKCGSPQPNNTVMQLCAVAQVHRRAITLVAASGVVFYFLGIFVTLQLALHGIYAVFLRIVPFWTQRMTQARTLPSFHKKSSLIVVYRRGCFSISTTPIALCRSSRFQKQPYGNNMVGATTASSQAQHRETTFPSSSDIPLHRSHYTTTHPPIPNI